MSKLKNLKNKGFTLIEILVVVTIIGILASITLLGLGPARRSAQDARRVADLRSVQTVLEVYFNRNGRYPVCPALTTLEAQTITNLAGYGCLENALTAGTAFGGVLPTSAKLPNDTVVAKRYGYQSNGSEYTLGTAMDISRPAGAAKPVVPAVFAGMVAYCSGSGALDPDIPYCANNP
jgi:prepilin-type N-terminal cleavage/methylation domain-containing protein